MRENIDSNSRNDKYSSISKANMKFENELKNLAIRQPNQKQHRESTEKPFADEFATNSFTLAAC